MITSLYLSFIIIVIAGLSSLTLYLQPHSELYLKIFPIYMVITVLAGGFLIYSSLHNIQNTVVFNFFSPFEFCFYFFVLSQIIQNKRAKRIIIYTLIIYPVFTILNTFFFQKITAFQTIGYSLGCLFIVAICIYYFFEIFQLTTSVNLLTQPAFWICSGLLFFYSCTFPVFSLINLLQKPSLAISTNLTIISNLLDVCLYSSFTIAFLCRFKIRKSMS
jgi:hypothetical protein